MGISNCTFLLPISHTSGLLPPQEDITIQCLLIHSFVLRIKLESICTLHGMVFTLKEDITELGKLRSRNPKMTKGKRMTSRGLDPESWACGGDSEAVWLSPVKWGKEGTMWMETEFSVKVHTKRAHDLKLEKRYTAIGRTCYKFMESAQEVVQAENRNYSPKKGKYIWSSNSQWAIKRIQGCLRTRYISDPVWLASSRQACSRTKSLCISYKHFLNVCSDIKRLLHFAKDFCRKQRLLHVFNFTWNVNKWISMTPKRTYSRVYNSKNLFWNERATNRNRILKCRGELDFLILDRVHFKTEWNSAQLWWGFSSIQNGLLIAPTKWKHICQCVKL